MSGTRYTAEFKAEAVKQITMHGHGIVKVEVEVEVEDEDEDDFVMT